MKVQHVPLGEAHAFSLLRLCYNCIRSLWRPGGYPPTATAHAVVPGTKCAPCPLTECCLPSLLAVL